MTARASSAPEGSGWIVHEFVVGSKSTIPVEESLNRRGNIARRVVGLSLKKFIFVVPVVAIAIARYGTLV